MEASEGQKGRQKGQSEERRKGGQQRRGVPGAAGFRHWSPCKVISSQVVSAPSPPPPPGDSSRPLRSQPLKSADAQLRGAPPAWTPCTPGSRLGRGMGGGDLGTLSGAFRLALKARLLRLVLTRLRRLRRTM